MRTLPFILIILFTIVTLNDSFAKPNKNQISSSTNGNQNGVLEFYLIESFETQNNSCEIVSETISLSDSVIIRYADIISYDPKTYTFELSEVATKTISNLQPSTTEGIAFAAIVNEKTVYTGYFWTGLSSYSCKQIIIDVTNTKIRNNVKVDMGYPSGCLCENVVDQRNASQLIGILEGDNKLLK